jgi:N utilization substance protein B
VSKRRQVRERVLQALYAQEVSGDDADHVLATLVRPPFADDPVALRFAEKLFLRGLDVRADADALLEAHVRNWEVGRLALTDRLVIRLAVAELLHFEDVPPKVTLNEALELAKAFSTEKSGAFVNGVLDAILKDLREAGRLRKSGRGLVDVSLHPERRRRSKPADPDAAPDDADDSAAPAGPEAEP